ncbi:MAG TPA: hypothetical protein VGK37_12165 [Casimicrobiaceae bacterium]|jgi:hypothetical protein
MIQAPDVVYSTTQNATMVFANSHGVDQNATRDLEKLFVPGSTQLAAYAIRPELRAPNRPARCRTPAPLFRGNMKSHTASS